MGLSYFSALNLHFLMNAALYWLDLFHLLFFLSGDVEDDLLSLSDLALCFLNGASFHLVRLFHLVLDSSSSETVMGPSDAYPAWLLI